jgi:hypothetical protein
MAFRKFGAVDLPPALILSLATLLMLAYSAHACPCRRRPQPSAFRRKQAGSVRRCPDRRARHSIQSKERCTAFCQDAKSLLRDPSSIRGVQRWSSTQLFPISSGDSQKPIARPAA